MPGLLWGELQIVLQEYQDFERGIKGTRFDTWLKKNKKTS
jgi:hypothetical protein